MVEEGFGTVTRQEGRRIDSTWYLTDELDDYVKLLEFSPQAPSYCQEGDHRRSRFLC